MGWYGGTLAPHNHTAVTGQGGVLSNLSVTGTLSATGNIASSGGNIASTTAYAQAGLAAALAGDLPRLDQTILLGLLGG